MGEMQHFTYEPSEDGYEEVELFRGVHPMMGERLHLWRLKNFKIERLPSMEDVYLLHAVANENPKDERLFAVAEVRDLTPVRDKWGRIVQLPSPRAHVRRGHRGHPAISDEAFAAQAALLEPHLSLRMADTQPQAGRSERHRSPAWRHWRTASDWSRSWSGSAFPIHAPESCAIR